MKFNQQIMLRLSILLSFGFWIHCNSPEIKAQEISAARISFDKQVLTEEFIAEGVAVGDVNRDGLIDVMAGPYWFEAPDWKKHELDTPEQFDFAKEYSNAFISQGMDVNGDGWV